MKKLNLSILFLAESLRGNATHVDKLGNSYTAFSELKGFIESKPKESWQGQGKCKKAKLK